MSFVSDTLLSGGARLHVARGGNHGADSGKRTSQGQSQGGRFEPLFRFVKDPLGALGGPRDADEVRKAEEEEHRKQLLQLRMREVEHIGIWALSSC